MCVMECSGKLLLDDDISATDFDDIQPLPVTGAIQKKTKFAKSQMSLNSREVDLLGQWVRQDCSA